MDPELAAKPLSDVDSTLRLQFICGLCDTKAEVAVAKAFKWTLEEMRVLVTGGGFPANFATAAARAKHGRKAGVSRKERVKKTRPHVAAESAPPTSASASDADAECSENVPSAPSASASASDADADERAEEKVVSPKAPAKLRPAAEAKAATPQARREEVAATTQAEEAASTFKLSATASSWKPSSAARGGATAHATGDGASAEAGTASLPSQQQQQLLLLRQQHQQQQEWLLRQQHLMQHRPRGMHPQHQQQEHMRSWQWQQMQQSRSHSVAVPRRMPGPGVGGPGMGMGMGMVPPMSAPMRAPRGVALTPQQQRQQQAREQWQRQQAVQMQMQQQAAMMRMQQQPQLQPQQGYFVPPLTPQQLGLMASTVSMVVPGTAAPASGGSGERGAAGSARASAAAAAEADGAEEEAPAPGGDAGMSYAKTKADPERKKLRFLLVLVHGLWHLKPFQRELLGDSESAWRGQGSGVLTALLQVRRSPRLAASRHLALVASQIPARPFPLTHSRALPAAHSRSATSSVVSSLMRRCSTPTRWRRRRIYQTTSGRSSRRTRRCIAIHRTLWKRWTCTCLCFTRRR